MNLATFLSLGFWVTCVFSPAIASRTLVRVFEPAVILSQAAGCSDSTHSQQQSSSGQPASASGTPQTAPPSTSPKSKIRKRKKKKSADSSNCSTGSTAAAGVPANPPAAKDCPPQKTVVRNGGTSEPAVQITGGAGAAHAQERSTTDQLLGSAEDNLKKIEGRSLTSTQSDMVSQVRQYITQSKEAVTAGDTERGRMLAQKAQLLSDELVKP